MAGNYELATELQISKSTWEIRRVPQPWLLTEVKVAFTSQCSGGSKLLESGQILGISRAYGVHGTTG